MTTTPQSMSDLPELPEPFAGNNYKGQEYFTRDQVAEYGRLCRATAEQADTVLVVSSDGRMQFVADYDCVKGAYITRVPIDRAEQAGKVEGDVVAWLVNNPKFPSMRLWGDLPAATEYAEYCGLPAEPLVRAKPTQPAAPDLPGMWEAADFTGGDPDERCHSERAATQQPVAEVIAACGGFGFKSLLPFSELERAVVIGTKLYAAPVSPSREVEALVESARRLLDGTEWGLGGSLSPTSRKREIPSRAGSMVKTRHIAALRDALAALAPVQEKAP